MVCSVAHVIEWVFEKLPKPVTYKTDSVHTIKHDN